LPPYLVSHRTDNPVVYLVAACTYNWETQCYMKHICICTLKPFISSMDPDSITTDNRIAATWQHVSEKRSAAVSVSQRIVSLVVKSLTISSFADGGQAHISIVLYRIIYLSLMSAKDFLIRKRSGNHKVKKGKRQKKPHRPKPDEQKGMPQHQHCPSTLKKPKPIPYLSTVANTAL
jgi:hypothetical protein